jgi:hypothetical protein
MISIPVKIIVQTAPASYVPPDDMQGVLEAIPQYTTYEMNDTGANVAINASSTGVDTAGLWVWTLNQFNMPPRVMAYYTNQWLPYYTGRPGELRSYIGAWAGTFDTSGRAYYGSGWDGWCLCNGQNGTVDIRNRFVIPGYRWDGGGWVVNFAAYGTGLNDAYNYQGYGTLYQSQSPYKFVQYVNLPKMYVNMNMTDFFKWTSTGHGENWTAIQPGGGGGGDQGTWAYPIDQWPYMIDYPLNILPPFIAVGYAQFMGYQ